MTAMFRSSVVTKGKGFAPLKSTIDKYPQRFNAVARTVFIQEGYRDELLNAMREKGAPSTSPVNWDSLKQMRAYYASDGFGRGIPTRRTDQIVNSATVTLQGSGNGLTVKAGYTNPNAVWVVGNVFRRQGRKKQSRIHKGRWKLVEPKIERWRTRYLNRVIAVLPDVFAATGAR